MSERKQTCKSLIRIAAYAVVVLFLVPLHLSHHGTCSHATCKTSHSFLGCCCLASSCVKSFLQSLLSPDSCGRAWSTFLEKPVQVLLQAAAVNLGIALLFSCLPRAQKPAAAVKGLLASALGVGLVYAGSILYGAHVIK